VTVSPILERYGDFASFLGEQGDLSDVFHKLRQSETTGKLLGSEAWLDRLAALMGKDFKPKKRSPKRKGVKDG